MLVLLLTLYFYPPFSGEALLYIQHATTVAITSNSGHICISSSSKQWIKINGTLYAIDVVSFLYIKPKIIFDTDCNSRMSWACWRQKAPDSVSKKPWRCWHAGCRRNKLRKTLWKSTCDGMPTDAGKTNPTWHLQGSSTHYHCKHTGKDSRPEPVSRQGQQKALHCTSPQAWPAFQSTASSPLCHSGPLAGTKEEEGNNPPTTCSLWSIWCQYFEREP